MSLVETYATDAHASLKKAQEIAQTAHLSLSQTHKSLSKSSNLTLKCEFLLTAIEQQLAVAAILLNSARKWVSARQADVDDALELLSEKLERLTKEMDSLGRLSVEASLLGDKPGSTRASLADFVSNGLLEELEQAYDAATKWSNAEFDNVLKQSVLETQQRLSEMVMEFRDLEKYVAGSGNRNAVEKAVEDINVLEKELAELIASLTDHYDQCLKGVDVLEGRISIDDEEKRELFEVLANDYEQVPEIITDIEQVSNDIVATCAKIEKYLSKISFPSKCQDFLSKLIQFDDENVSPLITQINSKQFEIQSKVESLSSNHQEAINLSVDLSKFQQSFYSLILELERRRSVQKTIIQLLEEAQTKVQALQQDDYRFIKKFWSKNADSLPHELYSEQKESYPLCEISVKYNEIPKINDSMIKTARKFLQK